MLEAFIWVSIRTEILKDVCTYNRQKMCAFPRDYYGLPKVEKCEPELGCPLHGSLRIKIEEFIIKQNKET